METKTLNKDSQPSVMYYQKALWDIVKQIKSKGDNLITRWLGLYQSSCYSNEELALLDLNFEYKYYPDENASVEPYTMDELKAWRDGEKPVPDPALSIMRTILIEGVLFSAGEYFLADLIELIDLSPEMIRAKALRQQKQQRVIQRAAELIEIIAADLKESHSVNGKWNIAEQCDQSAKDEYEEMNIIATKLKAIKQGL